MSIPLDLRLALLERAPTAFSVANFLVPGVTGDDLDEDADDTAILTSGLINTLPVYGGGSAGSFHLVTFGAESEVLSRASAMSGAMLDLVADLRQGPVTLSRHARRTDRTRSAIAK